MRNPNQIALPPANLGQMPEAPSVSVVDMSDAFILRGIAAQYPGLAERVVDGRLPDPAVPPVHLTVMSNPSFSPTQEQQSRGQL